MFCEGRAPAQREDDDGVQRDEHASLAKAFATTAMRETVGLCRELLGGNGIVLDYDVARFHADAEALYSYEGTREMNSLIVGRAITGVGALSADAIVATIGNGGDFKNGRQCAAWMGLTPGQHGTGGVTRLGKISRRGDNYLRTLLIQGARSSLQRAKAVAWEKATPEQRWIQDLERRLPFGKVLVAIANKHARQLWAMLARGEHYDAEAWLKHPMVQRPAKRRAAE